MNNVKVNQVDSELTFELLSNLKFVLSYLILFIYKKIYILFFLTFAKNFFHTKSFTA